MKGRCPDGLSRLGLGNSAARFGLKHRSHGCAGPKCREARSGAVLAADSLGLALARQRAPHATCGVRQAGWYAGG